MFEGICIIAGVVLIIWALRRLNKKGKAKSNHAPPVRTPSSNKHFASPYGKQKESDHGFFDDLLAAGEEIIDAVTTSKRSSRSSRDTDSFGDSWGGDD